MLLTLSISTFNRYNKLSRLLKSLEDQYFRDFKVLIMDASNPFISLETDQFNFNVTQVKAVEPNLPLQRWQSIEMCDTEYIGLLDDDVTLTSDYLDNLVKYFVINKDVYAGGAGWIQHNPEIRRGKFTRIRYAISGINRKFQGNFSIGGFAVPFFSKPREVVSTGFLMGASMFYKTEIAKKHGHLPWLYLLYREGIGRGEDIALSGNIAKNGFRFFILPDITCFHHTEGGGTSVIARRGLKMGIADTYGRYSLARSVIKRWRLKNQLAFFRYVFCICILFNPRLLKDMMYVKGLVIGLKKVFLFSEIK